jgi:hypothetical protein
MDRLVDFAAAKTKWWYLQPATSIKKVTNKSGGPRMAKPITKFIKY